MSNARAVRQATKYPSVTLRNLLVFADCLQLRKLQDRAANSRKQNPCEPPLPVSSSVITAFIISPESLRVFFLSVRQLVEHMLCSCHEMCHSLMQELDEMDNQKDEEVEKLRLRNIGLRAEVCGCSAVSLHLCSLPLQACFF